MNDTNNSHPTSPMPESNTALPPQESQPAIVNESISPNANNDRNANSDANFAITTGLGVGALGVGASLLTAATCPLCVVIAPALVGVGVYKKYKLRKQKK